MTSIDRTIYRHVKRNYTAKELVEAYTPTEEEDAGLHGAQVAPAET